MTETQENILCGEVLLEILLKFLEGLKNGWSNTVEKYAIEFTNGDWANMKLMLVLHEVFKYNVVKLTPLELKYLDPNNRLQETPGKPHHSAINESLCHLSITHVWHE